jgi:2,5-diketo-D-gluconate reductase B
MTRDDQLARELRIRGTAVPRLGFGTWKITGAECFTAVRDALDIGYRHIDTARAYGNEREVGAALAVSGVDRSEVFLTTKIWMDDFEPSRLRAAAEDSLRKLGTDYVDLLLLHWPNPAVELERTLDALVALRDEGLIAELGVSNFPPDLLREALRSAPVFCDQVEMHPFLGQDELEEIAAAEDLMITAYAPLAQGDVLRDPVLARIGAEVGAQPSQVALRWLLDRPQVAVIPKAASRPNRLTNFGAFDVELSSEQTAAIDALPKDRRHFDPAWAPEWAA